MERQRQRETNTKMYFSRNDGKFAWVSESFLHSRRETNTNSAKCPTHIYWASGAKNFCSLVVIDKRDDSLCFDGPFIASFCRFLDFFFLGVFVCVRVCARFGGF